MSATDSGVTCTTPFMQCFTLSFANGRILSDSPWKVTVSIRSVLDLQFGGGDFTGSDRSNFGWIVRPLPMLHCRNHDTSTVESAAQYWEIDVCFISATVWQNTVSEVKFCHDFCLRQKA